MRFGRGHQRIDVFRLVVERLKHRQLQVELMLPKNSLRFFNHGGGGAVGELWIKRRQGDALVAGGRHAHQRRLDRRFAVAHRQLDRAVMPLGGHRLLQSTTENDQRRALVPPDRGVGMGRLFGTLDQNQ
ncbi:hypothetical protein D3C81_1933540 [compost metagenome]